MIEILKSIFFKSGLIFNIATYCLLSFFKHPYFNKVKLKLIKSQKRYHIQFQLDSIEFKKFNKLLIRNLKIVSSSYILNIQTIRVHLWLTMPSGWRFIRLYYVLENANLDINYSQYKKSSNQSATNRNSAGMVNFKSFYNIIFRILNLTKIIFLAGGRVHNLTIFLYRNKKKTSCLLKNISIDKELIRISCQKYGNVLQDFSIQGSFRINSQSLVMNNIQFGSDSEKCITSSKIKISFKKLNFQISTSGRNTASVYFNILNGNFQIPQICKDEVSFPKIQGYFKINRSKQNFEIEDTSFFKYNNLKLKFFFKHEYPSNVIHTELLSDRFTMKELFKNIDSLKYKPLYNLKFKGEVTNIKFILFMNLKQPWRNIVKLKIDENLQLLSVEDDWKDLNSVFQHRVKEENTFVRNINLDRENKNFILLEDISNIFIQTILFTEDPQFFEHNGINEKFIGYAIAQNLTERKFARGASTISMQMVRNLFLGHEKSIFRKFEEILLTLLIENIFKISKRRILEIYLNIIELGPSIYGISEACEYYFNKKPSDLTPKEIIILSYIIPRPKFFMKAFENSSTQLKRNLTSHIETFSKKLLRVGLIDNKQAREMLEPIHIRGEILELEQ